MNAVGEAGPLALKRATDASMDGIAVLDDEGHYAYVNEAHASVYGYDDPESLLGRHWHRMYDDDELARFEETVLPALEAEGQWRGEATGTRRDGSTFPQELTLTALEDGGLVCVVRDVSERIGRERELRERTERLETLVDNVPVVTFSYDADGVVQTARGKGLEALGLAAADAVGNRITDVVPDPDVAASVERALDGEEVHATFDVQGRVIQTWARPVFDEDGDLERVVGVSYDVTEREVQRRQLGQLHEASRKLNYAESVGALAEQVVAAADDVLDFELVSLLSYDETAGRLVSAAANDAVRETLGTERPTPVGPDTLEMRAFESRETLVVQNYADAEDAAHPDASLGTVVMAPLGSHGALHLATRTERPVAESEQHLVNVLAANAAAAFDRATRERDLQQRNEQLAFLNGLLRHDVLNDLTVIRALAEDLADGLDGEQADTAGTIREWSDESIDLIRKVREVLKGLGAGRGADLRTVDVVTVLERRLDRLSEAHADATLSLSGPDAAYARADDMLGDVLGNVLGNAIDHAGDAPRVEVSVTDAGEETVTVRVADDGPGIPPEDRERVFGRDETGGPDPGSGFGLFFVDRMVDRYGGRVRIEDADLGGAAFVIELQAA